ncbi:hypothetical protein FACS1894103_6970 [Campylobacterota bacterium]|nr:hypothetical protein FACS1894103_6970 [Campylobacterota bacterium]
MAKEEIEGEIENIWESYYSQFEDDGWNPYTVSYDAVLEEVERLQSLL